MNDWSRNRKRIVLVILFFVVAVLVGVPFFFLFYRTPSCSDGAMNGDEKGVDCGGSCQRLCAIESLPIIAKGDPRILTVATSTYEVVALLENPNAGAEIRQARYALKIYSAESLIPEKTIEGAAYIPRAGRFAVFEGPFTLGDGVAPVRATLEWEQALIWEKNTVPVPALTVGDKTFSRASSSPRLEVRVENPTLEIIGNIDLTALLYDASGNVFAASKTFVDELPAGGSAQAIFTWPRPLVAEAAVVEILTRILPDRSYLR
jgi:hypothetical protein